MISDIRIAIDFNDHPKRKKLAELLGIEESAGYLLDLWIAVGMRRPSGNLSSWDEKDIAAAAHWKGDAKVFVKALIDSRFIEKNGSDYKIHKWEKHQLWVINSEKRSEQARINVQKRWDRRNTDGNTDFQPSGNTDVGIGRVRKGKDIRKEECEKETELAIDSFTILDFLNKRQTFDWSAQYLINDRDYLALIKMEAPEKPDIEIEVAMAWVGYRRYYRHGTSLKGSCKTLTRFIQDKYSVRQIWNMAEKSYKKDTSRTALDIWEVITAPTGMQQKMDESHETAMQKQHDREAAERKLRELNQHKSAPKELRELIIKIAKDKTIK